MARKQPSTPTINSPPVKDNFSLIKGIGPILSRRLHNASIYTYNQLAAQSPAELAKKVSGRSVKQITKQDWVGQARKIAQKKTSSKNLQNVKPQGNFHQHYENFTVELLLDEKNRLRRTRVLHIQTGDTDTWQNWEADQLIDFIARHARVYVPPKRLEKPEILAVERQSHRTPDTSSNSMEVKRPEPLSQFSDIFKTTLSDAEITNLIIQSPAKGNATGMLCLQDFMILTVGSDSPLHYFRQDQPCRVRFTLNFANVSAPGDIPLRCKTTIKFKQLGGASCVVVEKTNIIELSERVTLDILCSSSQPGLYRPDVYVSLFSEEKDIGLIASISGELIQIY